MLCWDGKISTFDTYEEKTDTILPLAAFKILFSFKISASTVNLTNFDIFLCFGIDISKHSLESKFSLISNENKMIYT